ncbi:MAG: type II toxin-antitoxin system RelE/ParE family toxin [Betaproteobacteria bacterium]|nr:type II toxin-antitoxin system RelE/ParE family toxin [Betaproteobacteria bacterium]
MPTYRLKFTVTALAEWRALDGSVKETFRKLLKKRMLQPHLPGSALKGPLIGCYKIKLRQQGYRLIYTVQDEVLTVLVLTINKRENNVVYLALSKKLTP